MKCVRNYGCSAILMAAFLACAAIAAPVPDLEQARGLYQKTAYQDVLRLLDAPQENRADAYALIGKSRFMLGDYGKATEAFERATQLAPNNSEYLDWLGRAYGRRAETSSVFTAWNYARKCRESFERALQADPHNLEAVDDLFEFQIDAPGMVGGGVDKAAQLAESIRDFNKEKYHSLQARLADKRKDYAAEEQQLGLAMEAAPKRVARMIDMAQFLAKRGRFDESDAMFERARKMEPENAQLKFSLAKTYIQTGRNKQEATRLLKQYLASALSPDDPPRSEAERLLKDNS